VDGKRRINNDLELQVQIFSPKFQTMDAVKVLQRAHTLAWLSVDKRVIDFSEVGQLETARESDLIDYNIYQPAYRLGGVA
jgi:hypothetical protein